MTNSIISNNIIITNSDENYTYGISLTGSSNNNISNNEVLGQSQYSINLASGSNNNMVSNNIVTKNITDTGSNNILVNNKMIN